MKNNVKNKSLVQFLLFMLVGFVNWLVNYAAYSILVSLGVNYIISNIGGFILSVISSYLLNGKFVFKKEDDEGERVWWRVLLRLYVSYAGTGLILSNILLWLWIDVVNLSQYMTEISIALSEAGINISNGDLAKYLAPFINMIIITPLNFVINKFWAYKTNGKTNN